MSIAARTVVQLMLPVLKRLHDRYSRAFASAEDCAQDLVAALLDRISTYPMDRRPTRVAANLAADTRHVLLCNQPAGPGANQEEVDWSPLPRPRRTSPPASASSSNTPTNSG